MANKIIIQGEQGAYSHLAAVKIFKNPDMICCKTFEDAFVKTKSIKNSNEVNFYYHHVGIYGYRYEILKKFISLKRSDNEINRSLEQMRAMDNDISISVGLTDSYPLGVDTIEDLEEIRNIMKNGQ